MSCSDRFVQVDESKVYVREWIVNSTAPHVLFVHGLGEHCSRYDSFFRKFNDAGVSVTAFDLPGHGDTLRNDPKGTPGHLGSLNHFYNILDQLSDNRPSPMILVSNVLIYFL